MKVMLIDSPAYVYGKGRFTYGSRFGCVVPIPKEFRIPYYTPYMWSMGYASAILKRDTDNEVKALDAQAKVMDEEQLSKEIEKFNPDLLIAELPTPSFGLMMRLLKGLKDNLGFKLALTGLHVSGFPMQTMKENEFVDFVMPGEYELIVKHLILALEGKKKLRDVPNLVFRENKKIIKTKRSNNPFLDVSFDSLPYPDREDMPPEDYHNFENWGKPCVWMLASRGCPFQCKFCCATVLWKGPFYWKRSAKNIVDEMEFVREKYKAKAIWFDDDVILTPLLNKITEEIKRRGLNIPWLFMGSINLSEELLDKACEAGCVGISFGIESINPNILGRINKAWVNKKRVKNFVDMCNKKGLYTHGTFIVGIPHDTRESILRTLKFATELNLDHFQVYNMVPLPGTTVYKEAKEKGWIYEDEWINYEGDSPIMNYPWLSNKELQKLFNLWIHTRHYLMLKKQLKKPHILLRNQLKAEPNALKVKIKNFLFNRAEKPI